MHTILTAHIRHTLARLRTHLRERRNDLRDRPDAGYTTETVIITALLVGLGLAALGILAAKVTDKANSLTF